MDEKTKELIAIGVSVSGHCQPCFKCHQEQAVNLGITPEEIKMAISVGKTAEKAALKAMDNFAKEQIKSLHKIDPDKQSQKEGNSCCCADSYCHL